MTSDDRGPVLSGEDPEFLLLARRSAAYSFLEDPAEDIYTIEDGEPLESA